LSYFDWEYEKLFQIRRKQNLSGKALYRGLQNGLFCGLFIVIIIGFSPLQAQITEYSVPAGSLFNGLTGIAAGPDGAMWFSGNRNIGRITTAGVITVYPVPTSNDTSYSITPGPDGAMWFTESPLNSPASNGGWFAKIGRISTSGVITEYPLPDPMSIPSAITAGPDGALWFIESGNGKIGESAHGVTSPSSLYLPRRSIMACSESPQVRMGICG
jgi:streptogramin lyase